VKFIVNVRLMEKRVNSHVGNVMVEKVMTQYRTLGMTWKKKEKTHPIHPAMAVGIGGKGGGGRWEMLKLAVTAEADVARDSATAVDDEKEGDREGEGENESRPVESINVAPSAIADFFLSLPFCRGFFFLWGAELERIH
jgi:hypothetical protein